MDPRDQPALSFKELEIVSLLRTDTGLTRLLRDFIVELENLIQEGLAVSW